MPIISETDKCTEDLLKRKINFIGAEVLFKTEESQVASPEYIDAMHKKGLLLWANAIVYDYRAVLTAGHTDDSSLTGDPYSGWGWLVDRGYDIIQTDWTLAAKLTKSARESNNCMQSTAHFCREKQGCADFLRILFVND